MTAATTRSIATLQRTIGSGGGGEEEPKQELRLAFLGCEVLPPYGPYHHTAELFADLIAAAWSSALGASKEEEHSPIPTHTLFLEVFGASTSTATTTTKHGDGHNEAPPGPPQFPLEDDLTTQRFDGVILPGSFSSAYEADTPWILQLGTFVQTQLVANQIPTLGVCFGHQLYAHSFAGQPASMASASASSASSVSSLGGTAIKCPAGPQAGRKTTTLTPTGRAFLAVGHDNTTGTETDPPTRGTDYPLPTQPQQQQQQHLDLFCTHGDMVESLPPVGISLGGNEHVPIQAAVYFSAPVPEGDAPGLLAKRLCDSGSDTVGGVVKEDNAVALCPKVIAVTFQAHPEFAGWEQPQEPQPPHTSTATNSKPQQDSTLFQTMKLMKENGDLSPEDYEAARRDASAKSKHVNEESLKAMVAAGRLLGWFA